MKGSKFFVVVALFSLLLMVVSCQKKGDSVGSSNSGGDIFNETGYPIVKQPYTLRVMSYRHPSTIDYNDLPVFQELEKKTGIHIEWEYVGNDWGTQKPLVLGGGDLPDIFFGRVILNESDVVGNAGLFIQLDSYIEKYGDNIKKMFDEDPSTLKLAKAYDGNIYGLPSMYRSRPETYNIYGINQKWLDKLGLKMPTTTDEFYTVLKAFKERDPNGNGIADEIPWTGNGFGELCGMLDMFGAFGVVESMNFSWLSVTNGKVNYIPAQDGFADAVAYFHKLYSEGLMDSEFFTQDWGMMTSKFDPPAGSPDITGVGSYWSLPQGFGPTRAEYYSLLLPLKGPKGHQFWRHNPEFVQGGTYCLEITSKAKNPDIAFRWANAVYDEIVGVQLYHGSLGTPGTTGVTMVQHDDGSYEVMPPPEGVDIDFWAHGYALADDAPGWESQRFADTSLIDAATERAMVADKKKLAPYYSKEYYFATMTPDETNELATLRADIHGFAQEQTASWIVNGGVEKEYAGFVQQMENMGLREMEAIYQKA
jgi:putative aldouronate transport system substrate-binding protein